MARPSGLKRGVDLLLEAGSNEYRRCLFVSKSAVMINRRANGCLFIDPGLLRRQNKSCIKKYSATNSSSWK